MMSKLCALLTGAAAGVFTLAGCATPSTTYSPYANVPMSRADPPYGSTDYEQKKQDYINRNGVGVKEDSRDTVDSASATRFDDEHKNR